MIRLVLGLFILAIALPARAAVDIQTLTTPGGIDVWLVEEHSIPFIALEIRFKGGTSLDPAGKRGVVNLMTGLLEEGAGDLDSRGFSEAREALAASLEYRAFQDVIAISARFLTENREQAVALLKSSIMEPNFNQVDIDRVREQVLSGLRSDKTDPATIASQTFDAMAWGDHPYGSSGDGTEESVAALTRDDIAAAHRGAFARDRLFVSAVGDITAEELSALLDELFGDLPETGTPLASAANYQMTGGVTVVPFETPQSVAIFGHGSIKRDDPDYIAAFVLNEVFGGDGQDSRLMTEVREKRGLTYGVGTTLLPMDYGEMIIGQVKSDNSKISEAVKVIQDEWAKVEKDGITEEELNHSKTYLTGAYALRFDGNAPIARIMVGMQMIGLPPSYVTDRNDRVMEVTLEDIRRVAKRIYQPGNLRFVVVGQPQGLENTN